MEEFSLNRALIEHLISNRFDSKADFFRKSRINKATLWRWYSKQHYPAPETFLNFCGALDVDFLALLDVTPERVSQFQVRLAQVAFERSWKTFLPTLAFLDEFLIGPGDWPGDFILPHYNRYLRRARQWTVWEYEHDPSKQRSNYYGTFLLEQSIDPQVWYFAFSESQGTPWNWFRYGAVRKVETEVMLLNFTAESDLASCPDKTRPIAVQTYLGSNRAFFRVVSLHPFRAVFHQATPDQIDPVSFRYPGAPS